MRAASRARRLAEAAVPGRVRTVHGPTDHVVVVGAGLAGCSTALHLALGRPELRVAMLEATTVAAGASGRGTGLLGPRLGPPIDVARRRDGDRAAKARYLRSERAVRRVLELATRFEPDAVTPSAGQLVVGGTAAEQMVVRRRAAAYAQLGLPVRMVPAGPHAGPAPPESPALHYPTAAGVDPRTLTLGLARAAADAGATTVQHCPVIGLEPLGDRTRVITPVGAVLARAVVATVDVSEPGVGVRSGDQLTLQVCASATDPLPADLLATLGGPSGCQVLAASPLGAYRRITPEGRLMLGGGPVSLVTRRSAGQRLRAAQSAWAWQRSWLQKVHPELANIGIAHRWRGRISLTRDGLPILVRGSRLPEMWYAGGWNGHGLAATIEAGAQIAERILTRSTDDRVDGFSSGSTWRLTRPTAAPLVRAYLATQVLRICGPCRQPRVDQDLLHPESAFDGADLP